MDAGDFQTFYQENLGLIYRFVSSKMENRQEAEDLTSQIFLIVVRSLDLKRDPRSLRTWLFRVARTTIADYWRIHYNATKTLKGRTMENIRVPSQSRGRKRLSKNSL